MADPLPAKLAHSFHRTTRIELEVLLQEARLAYWTASQDPSYDPRKAAFSTFATRSIYWHLCDIASQHKSKSLGDPEELSDRLVDPQPDPEQRHAFIELLYDLPEDARTIVALILDDGSTFNQHPPAEDTSVRAAVRGILDWSESRVTRAWTVVREALRFANC